MRSIGIVRRIDELGRLVLPIEIRRQLEIAPGDGVEIFLDEQTVILKKYTPACIFCNEAENVIMFKGKRICKKCLEQIASENE